MYSVYWLYRMQYCEELVDDEESETVSNKSVGHVPVAGLPYNINKEIVFLLLLEKLF